MFGINSIVNCQDKKIRIIEFAKGDINKLLEGLLEYISYCDNKRIETNIEEFEDLILQSNDVEALLKLASVRYSNKEKIGERLLQSTDDIDILFKYFIKKCNAKSEEFEERLLMSDRYDYMISYILISTCLSNDKKKRFYNRIKESNNPFNIFAFSNIISSDKELLGELKIEEDLMRIGDIEYILYYMIYIDNRHLYKYFNSDKHILALIIQEKAMFKNKAICGNTYCMVLERMNNESIATLKTCNEEARSKMELEFGKLLKQIETDKTLVQKILEKKQ